MACIRSTYTIQFNHAKSFSSSNPKSKLDYQVLAAPFHNRQAASFGPILFYELMRCTLWMGIRSMPDKIMIKDCMTQIASKLINFTRWSEWTTWPHWKMGIFYLSFSFSRSLWTLSNLWSVRMLHFVAVEDRTGIKLKFYFIYLMDPIKRNRPNDIANKMAGQIRRAHGLFNVFF